MSPGLVASRPRARLAVAVVAPALLLAACGSSSSGYGTPTTGSSGGGTAGTAEVATHRGDLGTSLTDGSGRALYLFTADTAGLSTCTGACASVWAPLTTHGAARASSGAKSSMLGTLTRSDGSKQVTYAGHPLYYYAGDSAPADTNGEGSDEFGARWWLVSPAGAAVTQGGGSGSSGSTGSSGSSGGYSGGGGY